MSDEIKRKNQNAIEQPELCARCTDQESLKGKASGHGAGHQ